AHFLAGRELEVGAVERVICGLVDLIDDAADGLRHIADNVAGNAPGINRAANLPDYAGVKLGEGGRGHRSGAGREKDEGLAHDVSPAVPPWISKQPPARQGSRASGRMRGLRTEGPRVPGACASTRWADAQMRRTAAGISHRLAGAIAAIRPPPLRLRAVSAVFGWAQSAC